MNRSFTKKQCRRLIRLRQWHYTFYQSYARLPHKQMLDFIELYRIDETNWYKPYKMKQFNALYDRYREMNKDDEYYAWESLK